MVNIFFPKTIRNQNNNGDAKLYQLFSTPKNSDELVKSLKTDGKVKSTKFKIHACVNLVSRGVLTVRRSDSEMKNNAEIGLFTKPSILICRINSYKIRV